MSAFLEKDHLSNLLGFDIIKIAKEKYKVDYNEFVKQYEPKNANAAFFAEVLANHIGPDFFKALSVILTGKEHRLAEMTDVFVQIENAQKRIRKLVEKGTPKFIQNRLEKAAKISPLISIFGAPYQIATSSKLLDAIRQLNVIGEKQLRADIVFGAIKGTEFGLKLAEELVKFALIIKDEFIDRDFPKALLSPSAGEMLLDSFNIQHGNSLFVNAFEQALKNSGCTGLNLVNIMGHYANFMGRANPNKDLIEPISFPIFGTTFRINTSASSVVIRPPAPPVDPVNPPVDPVTPPVDPVEPEPEIPPVSNLYAKVEEYSALVSKIKSAIEEKANSIQAIEAVRTVAEYQQEYIKQIIFSYACVLYAHRVSMLGSVEPEQYVAATSAIKQEVFGSPLVGLTEVIPMIEAWEAQGNRIENFGDASVDNRYLSFEQAQYALYTLFALCQRAMLVSLLRSISFNVAPTEEQFNAISEEQQTAIIAAVNQAITVLGATYGTTGENIILPDDVNNGVINQFIRARREEFFGQPEVIAAEEEAGVYRFAYLVTDGLLPQSNFVPVTEPVEPPGPGPIQPPADNIVELSSFVQHLIDDQANAGLVGRIIASAYSILMQRIFTNNVNAGVLEFEGVTVEVTNPEAMMTQMVALKEKVLSLLISIPESSPMHINFSLIKQKLMDDSNNYQELSALVLDTAQSVYKVGDEIATAAYTVFLNVLGLNVIGNQMAGVDPTSNALDISRILLDRPIESMDGLDPSEVVSSFAPVFDFSQQLI